MNENNSIEQDETGLFLDIKDMAEWIQNALLKRHSISVSAQDIERILNLESDYLIEKGYASLATEEE